MEKRKNYAIVNSIPKCKNQKIIFVLSMLTLQTLAMEAFNC